MTPLAIGPAKLYMERPKTLSAAFVRTVTRPGRYGDGRGSRGLYLRVHQTANGRVAKNWAQRLRIGGQVTNVGLGSYPSITLASARERAIKNAQTVAEGADPRTPLVKVPTFARALDQVIAIHRDNWKDGGKTESLWRGSLEDYAMPRIGRKLVSDITSGDALAVLVPIWAEKRPTAMKVRRRIPAVMNWAIAEGYRDDNPAGDAIMATLPRGEHTTARQRALPFSELGAAVATIRDSRAWLGTKLAFEFLTLTASRSNEVRPAEWAEFDPDSMTWTVPAGRMKAGREHRIPLSRQARAVLQQARAISDGTGVVPSQRGRPLTDSTINKLVRENNIMCVPHGMRSSYRDWTAECDDVPREIAEHALGHVDGSSSELAYRRTNYFERRRALMQEWADYVAGRHDGGIRYRLWIFEIHAQ